MAKDKQVEREEGPIQKAEKLIVMVLRDLERSADCIVDTISIQDIETTCLSDDRPQLQRRVIIETHRLPGQKWYP